MALSYLSRVISPRRGLSRSMIKKMTMDVRRQKPMAIHQSKIPLPIDVCPATKAAEIDKRKSIVRIDAGVRLYSDRN
jgi:hypothetical protein